MGFTFFLICVWFVVDYFEKNTILDLLWSIVKTIIGLWIVYLFFFVPPP